MLTLAERTAKRLSQDETAELAREYRRTGDDALVARIVEGNLRWRGTTWPFRVVRRGA
jgi:hypothetical protein